MSLPSTNRDNDPEYAHNSPNQAQGRGPSSTVSALCTVTTVMTERVNGLKLLSLDTGGLRGISQLQILAEVMNGVSREDNTCHEDIQRRPYEVFDVIGGVGTGGLIAILLVVFKMTASEALQEFTRFAPEIFIETIMEPKTRTEKLKQVIKRLLERHTIDGTAKLLAVNGSTSSCSCKLIVPIRYKDHVGAVCILRNYITAHEPPTNLTITEAMLATCATPPMFIPTSISKDFAIFTYVGGDTAVSNPTREIIAEAHRTFGDEATVSCLLSIGSGHPGVNSAPIGLHAPSWGDLYRHIAVEGEKMAEEMSIQMAQLTLYHRLSVTHGLEARTGPLREDVDNIVSSTTSYLKDLEVMETLDRCVEAIKNTDGFTTLTQLRHSGGFRILPPPLPLLTPNYVERKEPMAFIENALFEGDGKIKDGSKRLVVTGIGGCGKTQLIRKFVETHRNRFGQVIFLDGSSKEAIRRGLAQHTGSRTSLSSAMSVFAWPSRVGERLMIMDNFDDPTLNLEEYLPIWVQGTFIITSRNHFRGQLSPRTHLQLDSMSRSESVELIVRGLGQEWPPSESNKEAAILVVDELSCHPLALVQAVGYMYSTGYSPETYVSRLQSHRERLLRKPATSQIDMRYQSAFAAFDASYDILPPDAQLIIQFLSFFHWEDFPLELVIFGAENAFSIDEYGYLPRREEFSLAIAYLTALFCPSGGWDLDDLDSLIVALRNHSLVKVRSINRITLLQIHPLVHEWARLRVASEDVKTILAAARRLLSCAAKYDNPSMVQYLVAHIQKVSSPLEDLHANDIAAFGRILLESGMYSESVRLQECCLTTLNHQLGPDAEATISATAALGITCGKIGDYERALRLKEDVLERRVRLLGMDHPDTLHTHASVAVTYSDKGRYKEAEALQDKVLKRRTDLLGAEHLETIVASANLAATYGHMGRLAEAQALEEAVLSQYKKFLGMGHPCTLDTAANLAITHLEQEHYREAEDMQAEVLRSRISTMGERHPHTIRDTLTMGRIYHETNRNSEAFELVQKARRIALETLGKGHPISRQASMNLASLMFENPEYSPGKFVHDSDDPRSIYYYSNAMPERFPWPIKRSPAGPPEHSSKGEPVERPREETLGFIRPGRLRR